MTKQQKFAIEKVIESHLEKKDITKLLNNILPGNMGTQIEEIMWHLIDVARRWEAGEIVPTKAVLRPEIACPVCPGTAVLCRTQKIMEYQNDGKGLSKRIDWWSYSCNECKEEFETTASTTATLEVLGHPWDGIIKEKP